MDNPTTEQSRQDYREKKLIAFLEFTPSGWLDQIYVCTPSEEGQFVVERSLARLFRESLWQKVLSRLLHTGRPNR